MGIDVATILDAGNGFESLPGIPFPELVQEESKTSRPPRFRLRAEVVLGALQQGTSQPTRGALFQCSTIAQSKQKTSDFLAFERSQDLIDVAQEGLPFLLVRAVLPGDVASRHVLGQRIERRLEVPPSAHRLQQLKFVS